MESDERREASTVEGDPRGRAFSTREIALLGLMAALWGVIEITVGGMIKGWRVPFGGALLATFGVVILLTARAGVPRRWSSILIGAVAAGIRFASGFGGAMFASLGILAEALIVELVLSGPGRPSNRKRMLAGILAVLWALVHPFVVQGYLAGMGPDRVYGFTIGLVAGESAAAPEQVFLVFAFLVMVHAALGAGAVLFVDRILLAPLARARAKAMGTSPESSRAAGACSSRHGPKTSAAIVLGLVVLASVVPGSRAQFSTSSAGDQAEDGYTLPELTVTATRLQGPYSVIDVVISDILDQGMTDLSEALKMVPGLVVRTDARGEARLSARGLAEREIVILVDGVPISDPYTGSVSSDLMLAGALGRVRVTRGPASSIYGANSLGGIVEVTTVDRDRAGFSYMASMTAGGGYSGFVRGGGRLGGLRLAGGIAANGRSNFFLPESFTAQKWEDGGRREHTARDKLLLWGRASWDLGPTMSGSVSMQIADSQRDVPVSAISDKPRFWSFPFWRETRTVGSLAWQASSDWFFEGKLFYGTNDNQLQAFADFDRTSLRWRSSVANRTYGGYVYTEYDGLPGHRVFGGTNLRQDVAGIQKDSGADWDHYYANTWSVFGQDIINIGEKNRLGLAVNADFMTGKDRDLASFNPQISWTRRLPADMSVRLLASTKTRFPTLKEWYSREIGNPNLRSEKCVAYEIELTKRTASGSKFSVLAYDQKVEDMIVTAGMGDPARNLGAVNSWGAEVGASLQLKSDLRVGLTLAMTSAREAETMELVPLVPRTLTAVTADYTPGPAKLLGRVIRTGSRRGVYGSSLPPYTLIDLRAIYDTRFGSLFAGVENLFDVLYEDEEGFPQPGRTVEIGIMRQLYWE